MASSIERATATAKDHSGRIKNEALKPSPVKSVTPPEPGRPLAPANPAGVRPATLEVAALYEAWAQRVRGYIGFRVRDAADAEESLVGKVFRRVVSGPVPANPAVRPASISGSPTTSSWTTTGAGDSCSR